MTYPKYERILYKYLKDDNVSNGDKLDAIKHSIKGLQQLHQLGYTHSDDHLGNVMKEHKSKNFHFIDPESITYQESGEEDDLRDEIIEYINDYENLFPFETRDKIKRVPLPKPNENNEKYYIRILNLLLCEL